MKHSAVISRNSKQKCPDFSAEVALLIHDFAFSKEDIEFSFVDENLAQANLISLYVANKCISAILMDQHEKEFMYLGYMSTLGKWRRKGIGKTMVKLVIRVCFMMSKELKDVYLISRNIQDENGKWYSVKESPVYRFWESLGFLRIPWGKFPSIPTVLEHGAILTQARAYRFEMNEHNYNDYIKEQSIEQLIGQLRTQTKSEIRDIHLKVFSPNLHPESMKWPPLPSQIADRESNLAKRFHVSVSPAQMPPSYFANHQQRVGMAGSNDPMRMQQEMAYNNMMLQSMYMNQMMIMQQSMYAQRRRFAMQQAMQRRQIPTAAIMGGTVLTNATTTSTNQNASSNLIPAKRKLETNAIDEPNKKR